jgi:hypothetical protein
MADETTSFGYQDQPEPELAGDLVADSMDVDTVSDSH